MAADHQEGGATSTSLLLMPANVHQAVTSAKDLRLCVGINLRGREQHSEYFARSCFNAHLRNNTHC